MKRTYVTYVMAAAILLPLYAIVTRPAYWWYSVRSWPSSAPDTSSGFGVLTSPIYPRGIRATGQGFAYNTGRLASAAAPFAVGSLAGAGGFGLAFGLTGLAFLLAAGAWTWIPDLSPSDSDDGRPSGRHGRRRLKRIGRAVD